MVQPITSECHKQDKDGYTSDCGHEGHELQQCDNVSCQGFNIKSETWQKIREDWRKLYICETCEDCGYSVNENNNIVQFGNDTYQILNIGVWNMRVISHDRAIRIIAKHGFTPTEQTATYNGELVKSGYSFYEMLGNKETYKLSNVMYWLGY